MADDLILTAGIDARAALRQVDQLKRQVQQRLGGTFTQAMRAATGNPSTAGLNAIGGASQRAAASADAVALALKRATVQQDELSSRIRRGLADQTRQATQLRDTSAAFDRYRASVTAAGASQQTLRLAAVDLRGDLVGVKDDIIVANNVLRNWAETAKNTRKLGALGVGLQVGGAQQLRANLINLTQSTIAAGGSLNAFAVAAATQAPEAFQILSFSARGAALMMGGVAGAALAAAPFIAQWIANSREADRAEALHATSLGLLQDSLDKTGNAYERLTDKARKYLGLAASLDLESLTTQRDAILGGVQSALAETLTPDMSVIAPATKAALDQQAQQFDEFRRQTMSAGDAIRKAMGLAVEPLPEAANPARQMQDSLAQAEQAARIMDRVRTALKDGSKSLADAFAGAGVGPDVLARIGKDAADELFRLQGEIAKQQDQLTRSRGEPDTEARQRLDQLQQELRVQKELAGIADPLARARREAQRAAEAEAASLGLQGDALADHVTTAMQLYDTKAAITAQDKAAADALKDQSREMKALRAEQAKIEKSAERMSTHLVDAEAELARRRTSLYLNKRLLGSDRSAARLDVGFGQVRELEQIAGRIDLAGNPQLRKRFDELVPDIKKISEAEHALNRVVDVMRAAEPPTVALAEDTRFVDDAFKAGTLNADQYARATIYLKGRMGELAEEARVAAEEARRLRMEEAAAGGDWGADWSLAVDDLARDASDRYAVASQALRTVTDRTADSFADLVTTGKANFREFTSSLLTDMSRLISRMIAMQAVMAAIRAFSGAPPVATTNPYGTAGGMDSYSIMGEAGYWSRGGAIANGRRLTPFARGGAMDGGRAIMAPSVFPMRNGMGIAGENRRPEAIFPLHRDAQGRLGVKAKGDGGGGEGPTINIGGSNVTVEGGSGMGEAEAARIGKMIGQQIDRKINENMMEQSRPGGVLHRRYGR